MNARDVYLGAWTANALASLAHAARGFLAEPSIGHWLFGAGGTALLATVAWTHVRGVDRSVPDEYGLRVFAVVAAALLYVVGTIGLLAS